MSDDIVMQLSSNSNPSDPSLPTKLAKLEARMVGKSSTSLSIQSAWQPAPPAPPPPPTMRFPEQEELPDSSSSDDDNGNDFLIQHNTQKRLRVHEDDHDMELEQPKESINGRIKTLEKFDIRRDLDEPNKKKQGRGRGRPSTGRGRGSKPSDQTRSVSNCSMISSNGQHDNPSNKENLSKLPLGDDERIALQESVLHGKFATLEEELNKLRQEAPEYRHLSLKFEKELKELKEHELQMKPKRIKVISDLLISVSKAERQEARMKIRQESLRLGNIGVVRAGTMISEAWEDGQALKDLNSHLKSLLEMRETIERHRKSLKKRQPDKGDGSDMETSMSDEDFLIQDEVYKSRLVSIKREEETCLREKERYELEKGKLIREMKRIRDEDGSRFNNFPILNQRYALLNLLGKGGFSEVYKAFDLVEYRYVACKLHGLNGQWSEEKKQSYIRHAVREYNIHKTLVHQNIVRLWDIFEIDHNTFCTVLEYCSGKDLDAVLKATPILPEKEAKIIIVQIFNGLVYLNKRPQKIIHYDLKPGNVLFDEVGVAKVTDFGLSKIVEDDIGSQGMELTSQGAGTYWYLPPECFELSKTPLISSKMNCVHLENRLHEAREDARINLCAADRRTSEYNALRVKAVKMCSLFERFCSCVTAPGAPTSLADSLRSLAMSLASSHSEDEDDLTRDFQACIKVFAEKVSFLSRHRAELSDRCSRAEAAQGNLGKELEEKNELLKSLYTKHHLEKQANKEKITFGRFEGHELAAFVLNPAGHYEAINRNCPNYYLSDESVALFKEQHSSRPAYIIGQIVHIERRIAQPRASPQQQADQVEAPDSGNRNRRSSIAAGSAAAWNPYNLPVGCEYFIVTVAMLPDTIHSTS